MKSHASDYILFATDHATGKPCTEGEVLGLNWSATHLLDLCSMQCREHRYSSDTSGTRVTPSGVVLLLQRCLRSTVMRWLTLQSGGDSWRSVTS